MKKHTGHIQEHLTQIDLGLHQSVTSSSLSIV